MVIAFIVVVPKLPATLEVRVIFTDLSVTPSVPILSGSYSSSPTVMSNKSPRAAVAPPLRFTTTSFRSSREARVTPAFSLMLTVALVASVGV